MTEFFEEPSSTDKVARKVRRKRKAKSLARTSIIVLIVAIIVAFCSTLAWSFVKDTLIPQEIEDYSGSPGPSVVITIPDGAIGSDIATILYEEKVVASPDAFIKAFKTNPRSNSIQAGSYTIPTHISGADAVSALLDPASRAEYKITIPEGTTTRGIYEKIANVFGVSTDDVAVAAQDTRALGLPEQAQGNIEGWLAPLTYDFLPDVELKDVLAEMVKARIAELTEAGIPEDSWQKYLTLASIAEKEVNNQEDYPKVARALENRLAQDMMLQVDSSVAYGLGKSIASENLTTSDLETDTPYNTYMHKGLPPTPICNPGIEVVKAMMNPPEGDWLYWVTVNYETGETHFSSTLEEHNEYVAQFREYVESQQG